MKKRLEEFYKAHKWCVILVIIGIIVAVLILTINFWRTLLLCVLAGIGCLFGWLLDKGGTENVKRFFDKILPKK